MTDGVSSVLLRVAVELLARSNATKRYLHQLGQGERGEYSQLIATIRTALERIEAELESTVQGIHASLQAGVEPSAANDVFFAFLEKFSRWFTTIHELLAYLPAQNVKPETLAVLVLSFTNLYDSLRPSIILGSLFNALEFDLQKLVIHQLPDLGTIVFSDSQSIVLQLPICDRESPSAWSILAHELGHAVDIAHQLSENAVSKSPQVGLEGKIILNCTREVAADLIAACALGPAPILTTISLEYCVYPSIPIAGSVTHPTTLSRLEAVARFLRRRYGEDYLLNEVSDYRRAWNFRLMRSYPSVDEQKLHKQAYEKEKALVSAMAHKIENLLKSLSFPSHTTGAESLRRRRLRLEQGLPISAQGATKSRLRARLARYDKAEFASPDSRRAAFQELIALFQEQPMDAAGILTSCQKRRDCLIQQLVAELAAGKTDGVSKFAEGLEKLELLAANSINVSAVHHRMVQTKAGL